MEMILIGLSVITIVLLIALLCAVKKITSKPQQERETAPTLLAAPAADSGIAPEVVAAITAAIASVWEGESSFVVRHIKRVNHASAWSRSGREEQIFSRF